MARVRIQVAAGRPFQVDDFGPEVSRSREGAIYFRPGVLTVTTEELEHVRAKYPEHGARIRVLGWVKEAGVAGDTPRETPSPGRPAEKPQEAPEAPAAGEEPGKTEEPSETAGDASTGAKQAPEAPETAEKPSSSTEEAPPVGEAGTGESKPDSAEEADKGKGKESGKGKRKRRSKKKSS